MILGRRDVRLHFIPSLLPNRIRSDERGGWIIEAAWFGASCLRNSSCLLGYSDSAFSSRGQILNCSGRVGQSVAAELACV